MNKVCEICKGPIPTKGNCSLPIIWGDEELYVCTPQCEFALGVRQAAKSGAANIPCTICKRLVPTDQLYQNPMTVEGKDYYVCGPTCAYALGWRHFEETKNRTKEDA
jgi:hypothetical protein